MSIQNLTKENNYSIYCKTLNTDEINTSNATFQTLKVGTLQNLDGAPGNQLQVNANLVPTQDTARNIGASGLSFRDVYASNFYGDNSAINIVNGITGGSGGLDPLLIKNNGLKFTSAIAVNPIINYICNYYAEYTGTLTASGAIPDTAASFTAVRIGTFVNFSLSLQLKNALTPGGSTNPINIGALPDTLVPNNKIIIPVPLNVNNTFPLGRIEINGDTMEIYSSTNGSDYFINGGPAGLNIPQDGSLISFCYSLL